MATMQSLCLDNRDEDFLTLGRDLLATMSTYMERLKDTNLPCPSLRPSAAPTPTIMDGTLVKAREAIIEKLQTLYAMTMDSEMNLLISSLQFHFCSCLKVAVDLRVHEHVPFEGEVSLSELAAAVGAEERLLTRVMRVLTSKFLFMEPRPGYYAHTAISWALRRPNMVELLSHRLDDVFRSASREADALAAVGYHEPTLDARSGFHLAFNTNKTFWEYTNDVDPCRGRRFANAMSAVNINSLAVIPEMYPFDKLAADGGVIVDIGGGLGQVARQIIATFPNCELKCVVQDVIATKSSANPDSAIEWQQHDFFQPQPIRGAAVYFFRHIFHDWPDTACVEILRQTRLAMDETRSRILICDQVMADISPSIPSILYDIDMMTLFGGKERTLKEWETILNSVDERLYVSQVITTAKAPTTLIEVRLRE